MEAIVENGGVIRIGEDIRGAWSTNEAAVGSAGDIAKAAGIIFQDRSKEEADFVVLNTPLKDPRLDGEKVLFRKTDKTDG